MERLAQLSSHLAGSDKGSSTVQSIRSKSPDDVVVVAAYRTPIAKGVKGSFKNLHSEDLLYLLLREFKKKDIIDFSKLEDIACGNVLAPGAGSNEHRAAALAAGVPYQVPLVGINRQCSSGLMSVNYIANQIKAGQINVGLAAGSESMSQGYGTQGAPKISEFLLGESPEAEKCLIPMGITNENLAARFSIDRPTQDRFAAQSYAKAERAIESGGFRNEILAIPVKDEATGDVRYVSQDEGVRKGTDYSVLSRLKPAFKQDGTTHAGNSSQVSDGAAVVLLARREAAEQLSLPIMGKYVATQVVGVPPEIMGVGPAYAIPKLLSSLRLTHEDVDVFEINEAFAAQCFYCVQKVGIPMEKVNPKGGAIALGHPLGCTGARMVATVLNELQRGQVGVTSMCIGSGMGAAALFVRE